MTLQQGFYFQLSNRDRQNAAIPWGPANPQALNRYSYVQNNPLRYTDPTGHTLYLSHKDAATLASMLRDMASSSFWESLGIPSFLLGMHDATSKMMIQKALEQEMMKRGMSAAGRWFAAIFLANVLAAGLNVINMASLAADIDQNNGKYGVAIALGYLEPSIFGNTNIGLSIMNRETGKGVMYTYVPWYILNNLPQFMWLGADPKVSSGDNPYNGFFYVDDADAIHRRFGG